MHIRTVRAEVSAAEESDTMTAAGRAVPYGVTTILWRSGDYEEREVIEPGAFRDSIANDDQRALWNHRRDVVLGRKSANTLRLRDTEDGVEFEIDFPDSPEGQSKFANIRRGDIGEVSFGFNDINLREEFLKEGETRVYLRTVQKAELMEISPVTWAAYDKDTSIKAREHIDIEQRKQLIDANLTESSDEAGRASARDREAQLREIQLGIIGGR